MFLNGLVHSLTLVATGIGAPSGRALPSLLFLSLRARADDDGEDLINAKDDERDEQKTEKDREQNAQRRAVDLRRLQNRDETHDQDDDAHDEKSDGGEIFFELFADWHGWVDGLMG